MCHYLGGGLHGRQKRVKAQSESSKSVVNSVLISREMPVFPGFLEIIRVVLLKDGTNFHNEIKYDYIIKLLVTVGLIKLDDNLISTELHQKSQALMFDYPKKSENQERNKLICRKYRYRGK